MLKPILVLSLLSLTALGWMQGRRRPIVPLAEGSLTIEHVPLGEAVVRIEAESEEELERVRLHGPGGQELLELGASAAHARGLSGVILELREGDLDTLRANYAEGDYEIRATTSSGKLAVGALRLSFDLPPAPRIVQPAPGALVSASNLTVLWLGDRSVAGYRVQLEQGESDGLVVNLPPGRSSFRVPAGVLAPGQETHLEISALGTNGNRTLSEVVFATRP